MSVWPCATATKPLQKILALRVRLSVSGRHSRSPCPGQHRRYSSKYIPASASTAVTDKRFDILFCGSDEFSATSLKAVLGAPDLWRSVRVVVPHVKRKRRPKAGQVVELGVLAKLAEASDLTVDEVPEEGIGGYQMPEPFDGPPNPKSILITASFGSILPNAFLASFLPQNRFNVHPSLLPRWRGAAPIQWTIASGDKETGVVVQRLVEKGEGIDAGAIVGRRDGIAVPNDATYSSLLPILAEAGAELLVDALRSMREGTVEARSQAREDVTRAPKITDLTAKIRWREQTAQQLDRLSRGISHQGPLWTMAGKGRVQLLSFKPVDPPNLSHWQAALLSAKTKQISDIHRGKAMLDTKNDCLYVACALEPSPPPSPAPPQLSRHAEERGGEGANRRSDIRPAPLPTWIRVTQIRPGNRKAMGINEWWNGLPVELRKMKYIRFHDGNPAGYSDTSSA